MNSKTLYSFILYLPIDMLFVTSNLVKYFASQFNKHDKICSMICIVYLDQFRSIRFHLAVPLLVHARPASVLCGEPEA